MIDIYCDNINQICNISLIGGNDNQSVVDDIAGVLMQNALIEYCNFLICDKRVIVGVVPYPLYSRKQREELQNEICDTLYSLYEFDELIVCFDTDIIYQISKYDKQNIEVAQFDKIFDSVKNRK